MREKAASRLAWALAGLFVPLAIATKYLEWRSGEHLGSTVESVSLLAAFAVFAAVGALIAGRRPRNPIGWMLLAVALGALFTGFAATYSSYGLVESPGSLPGAGIMAWFESWTWYPPIGLMMTFLILLFPTGRLPSPRWRPLAWADAAFILVLVLPAALAPEIVVHGDTEIESVVLRNPLGIGVARGALESVESATGLVGVILLGLGVVSVFFRYRSAEPDERQQLKWFLYATGLVVGGMVIGELAPDWAGGNVLFAVLVSLLPISIAIAVLKHRLYDIDLVINRTIVYGAMAAFITLVYVAIVVGVGNLISARADPDLALQITATALVALLFQPARTRAQRLANRLVYGRRAEPYEVLARFSDRVAGTLADDNVLDRMAEIVGEATGATSVGVWLRVGSELRSEAGWPPGAWTGASVGIEGNEIGQLAEGGRTFAVREAGQPIGAVTITKAPGDPLRPAEESLLEDLAGQARLVLRNVRLIEELRASRGRLVAAQDEERRRIERNIHDGAQQQLVALAVNLKLARTLAAEDSKKAQEMLERLQSDTQAALEDLRDLARGIYPPLLADKGLPAAVEAQARKAPLPVSVDADGVGRFSRESEAAVYFCVLEALQNASKYAEASRATVRLRREDGDVSFEVADDGHGFDPARTPRGSGLQNMTDRIEALGGSIEIRSSPGAGTTVAGRLPAAATGSSA